MLLAELKQEDSLATVKVKAVDTVNTETWLVHEARHTSLFEELLQQHEHGTVPGTHDELLTPFTQLIDELLKHEHFARDQLLFLVMLEL